MKVLNDDILRERLVSKMKEWNLTTKSGLEMDTKESPAAYLDKNIPFICYARCRPTVWL